MDFLFADDSRQKNPSRKGMGPLVAVGGVLVKDEFVKSLEDALDQLCVDNGFPEGEEFKWSPDRAHWMRNKLTGDRRTAFFTAAVQRAIDHKAKAYLIIEDQTYQPANDGLTPERDVVVLLLERYQNYLEGQSRYGVIITDRPRGDSRQRQKWGCQIFCV